MNLCQRTGRMQPYEKLFFSNPTTYSETSNQVSSMDESEQNTDTILQEGSVENDIFSVTRREKNKAAARNSRERKKNYIISLETEKNNYISQINELNRQIESLNLIMGDFIS